MEKPNMWFNPINEIQVSIGVPKRNSLPLQLHLPRVRRNFDERTRAGEYADLSYKEKISIEKCSITGLLKSAPKIFSISTRFATQTLP